MRRLLSGQSAEEKQKKSSLIFAIAILALLVLSTAGFAFLSGDHTSPSQNTGEDQSNHQIQNTGNVFAVSGQVLTFRHNLDDVKDIDVTFSLTTQDFASKVIYLVSDDDSVVREIGSTLGIFSQRIQLSCLGSCELDFPEKDCTSPIIVYKNSTNNRVFQEDKCLHIEGDLQAVDAFLYKLFSIGDFE